jgi:hypothetical protein
VAKLFSSSMLHRNFRAETFRQLLKKFYVSSHKIFCVIFHVSLFPSSEEFFVFEPQKNKKENTAKQPRHSRSPQKSLKTVGWGKMYGDSFSGGERSDKGMGMMRNT